MKTVLEKLREQMRLRTTYDDENKVLAFQDYNNKKIIYNTVTGEMFTFSQKGGIIVKLGTPLESGKVYRRYNGEKIQVEDTSKTGRARIDVSVGPGERIFVTVAKAAAMLMDPAEFERINAIDEPVVFFKDANIWNLKGENLCWSTKDILYIQQDIMKTLKNMNGGSFYLRKIENNGYTKRDKYALKYPVEPQDIEDFRMVFAQVTQDVIDLLRAASSKESKESYTKLFIWYMAEKKKWPDYTKLMQCD